MSAFGALRMTIIALSVASVQALVVDTGTTGPFRQLELPLTVVVILVVLRPDTALTIGVIFGLAADLFHTRLFGLHCLAFSLLGSVAAMVPVGGLRTRTEAVACLVAVQVTTAVTVLTVGIWVSGGHPPPDIFGRYVQTTAWALLIAVPVISASGVNIGMATPEPPMAGRPPASSGEWS